MARVAVTKVRLRAEKREKDQKLRFTITGNTKKWKKKKEKKPPLRWRKKQRRRSESKLEEGEEEEGALIQRMKLPIDTPSFVLIRRTLKKWGDGRGSIAMAAICVVVRQHFKSSTSAKSQQETQTLQYITNNVWELHHSSPPLRKTYPL